MKSSCLFLLSALFLLSPMIALSQEVCEGNFDLDGDVDGLDAATFKADFGRSALLNPCITQTPCNGDFDCDGDADGTDASTFKQDFGRSSLINQCPYGTSGMEGCTYTTSSSTTSTCTIQIRR